MTNIQPIADRRRFNADIAGSQLLWSRHQIVQLFRRFIHEDRPVSVHYGGEDSRMVTRALRLNPRLDRVYFEYGDHKAGNSDLLRIGLVSPSGNPGS